jgi:hypothetical protein
MGIFKVSNLASARTPGPIVAGRGEQRSDGSLRGPGHRGPTPRLFGVAWRARALYRSSITVRG